MDGVRPTEPKMELFEKAFGPELSHLGATEWLQIDAKTGEVSKRVFGMKAENANQQLHPGAITGMEAKTVLRHVVSLLKGEKIPLQDKSLDEIAQKVFKNIKKQVSSEDRNELSNQLKHYLTSQLTHQKKLEQLDVNPRRMEVQFSQIMSALPEGMANKLGRDVQRHLRDANTVSVQGLQIRELEPTPGLTGEAHDVDVRAKRFEAMFNAFANKISTNPESAQGLKEMWKDIGAGLKNLSEFEKRIGLLYSHLSNVSQMNPEAKKIMALMGALSQEFYVTPSQATRMALKATLQPEVETFKDAQMLKDVSDGYGITFKFEGDNVQIDYHNRSINNDHPPGPIKDDQYPTVCKYEIKVKNTLTANLNNMQWKSQISAEVGIPPQSRSGAGMEAANNVIKGLQTAGFNPQITQLETNEVFAKFR